mgnify:CR=1 FL=1
MSGRLTGPNKLRRRPIDQEKLRLLLVQIKDGGLSIDDAVSQLRDLPFQDLGFAKVDHHRSIRQGFPEVVLGEGKTPEQVEAKLEKRVPQPFRLGAHHWLILHGRYVCKARTPECWRCPVVDLCSYRKKALEKLKGR